MKDTRQGAFGSDNERDRGAIPAAVAAEAGQDESDTEADPELESDPELEMVLVQELLMQDGGTEADGRELGNTAAAMPAMRPTAAAAGAVAERLETRQQLLEPMSNPKGWRCGAVPIDTVQRCYYYQH